MYLFLHAGEFERGSRWEKGERGFRERLFQLVVLWTMRQVERTSGCFPNYQG